MSPAARDGQARTRIDTRFDTTGGSDAERPDVRYSADMDDATQPDSDAPPLRRDLDTLVRALAALPDAERRDVVSAAEEAAAHARTLPWELWNQARGVVSLGGHAVEDCDRLYDGS